MRVDPIDAAKLALVLVAGVLAYRAWRAVSDTAGQAGAAIVDAYNGFTSAAGQLAADVQSAVVNAVSATPAPGEKAFLYSDANYTGLDQATGRSALDGARADEEFRRYEYAQRDAGNAPAATTNDGAAFGVYPSSGRRRG